MSPEGSLALRQYLGPLAVVLDDPAVMEVCINRPGEVLAEALRDGRTVWERHDLPALTLAYCRLLARLVATFAGKDVDRDEPILSATLPAGERIEVVLPPATLADRIVLTVRKPGRTELDLQEMERRGSFAGATFLRPTEPRWARARANGAPCGVTPGERELLDLAAAGDASGFLLRCVQLKKNILIAGKTQSGKTTLMKALIRAIPEDERLVTLEDVHELFLPGRTNTLHLFFAREGAAGPSASALLRSSVRHRPDRILPGELRGPEAWVYINALNTGHPGSISTVHANGAREALRRIADLIKDSPAGERLDVAYILDSLYATLDVVLYCEERRLREIYFDPHRKRRALG